LPAQVLSGLYRIFVQPTGSTTGSVDIAVATTALPSRPVAAALNTSNPLATNLAGLFVMNEGSGTLDANLVSGQVATFAGTTSPTWNTSDPSVTFAGGSSLASYLDGGADLILDQLSVSQTTVVAKVWVNTVAAAGIVEKTAGNIDHGFVFDVSNTG